MKQTLLSVCVGILCLSPACLMHADPVVREKELAESVIEKTWPDSARTIAVPGVELKDLTPAPEPAPADISPADRRRGFILYRRAASDQVFRRSAPQPQERVSELATAVSLDEKRHVQFAVYALADLGHVTVSAGPLLGPNGSELPADVLTVRPIRVGFWRDYWNAWFMEAPKLIDAPGTPSTVPANQSQQFWITVHAPSSAAPGEYRTQLTIQPQDGQPATLLLKVDILPFHLAPGIWWGVYYYSGFNENTPRDFADMKAHGVNSMLICPPGHVEPVLERQGDKVIASFPQTDKAMAELKKHGFNRPVAFYPRMLSCRVLQMFDRVDGKKFKSHTYYGQSAVEYQAEDFPEDMKVLLKDLYRQMVRHAHEADWPEILWYLVDEPGAALGHHRELEWAKVEYALFQQACPDERLLCTAYTLEVFKTIPGLDVCVGDFWRLDDTFMAYARDHGAQVWAIRWLCQFNTYGFPRHFAGLGLKKRGVNGFTEWTYYGAPLYRPYDQLLNKEGCHYAYVNEQGQLLSTIPWEAVQEGINDARYVDTLDQLMAKARSSQDIRHHALLRQGESALQQVMAAIPDSRTSHDSLPEPQLDELRNQLTNAITAFIKAGVILD